MLQDELSKEKVNFSKKAQNLDDSNKELQKIKKEIEKLNVKVYLLLKCFYVNCLNFFICYVVKIVVTMFVNFVYLKY